MINTEVGMLEVDQTKGKINFLPYSIEDFCHIHYNNLSNVCCVGLVQINTITSRPQLLESFVFIIIIACSRIQRDFKLSLSALEFWH